MKKISAFNVHCKDKETQWLEPLKKFTILEIAWVLVSGMKRVARLNVVGEGEAQGSPVTSAAAVLCHRFPCRSVLDSCTGAPWVKFRGVLEWPEGILNCGYQRGRGELRKWSECRFLWRREGRRIGKSGKPHWRLLPRTGFWLCPWNFSSCSFVADRLIHSLSITIHN